MSGNMKDCLKNCFHLDERQEMLLGVSKTVLIAVIGEPSATYSYQDKEILHYGRPELSFVEIADGVVSRCETLPERRASFRVRPPSTTSVCIITRYDALEGILVDLSMTGMKISLTQFHDFLPLEDSFLCFNLNIHGVSKKITVSGKFYRLSKEDGAYHAVFLVQYCGAEVSNMLLNYISQIQIEMLENYQEKFP
ncbi:MAG: PilZ domain-containing protein [Deltaproteobacteria bacterium]|nr:PilZ domain-containing protein [Deltaproteobacteria bacterium]